jgi:hypothetical protein
LQSLFKHFAIALSFTLQLLCGRILSALWFAIFDIALKSLRNPTTNSTTALQSLCNPFEVALGSVYDRSAIASKALYDRIAVDLY